MIDRSEFTVVATHLPARSGAAENEGALAAGAALAEAADAVTQGVSHAEAPLGTAVRLLAHIVASTADARARLLQRSAAEADAVRGEQRDDVATTRMYDDFFQMTRVGSVDAAEYVACVAPVLLAATEDLPSAPLTLDDVATIARLGARVLGAATAAPGRVPNPGRRHQTSPIRRWRLGHHLFALACRQGAAALSRATGAVAAEAWGQASGEVAEAVAFVPAITSSMVYASAMSRRQYAEEVRPLMDQPHVARQLTGGMNLDYAAYKMAMSRFLGGLANLDFLALDELNADLALGVDELLSLDLLDLERHIALSHRLVGTSAALHERKTESAVETLRVMYLLRARQYVPWRVHGIQIEAALEGES